ncbi:MAG: copper transporter [Actinomycetota bacterium]|nr:copper transporter [Actinomycetota bacterium]
MGYSARYHAASLAAVFLALAVGIVIGAGLGDDVLSGTEQNLRESLEGDIEDARGEADELQAALDSERAFGERAYPALVGETLTGRSIGVLAFGDLPSDVSGDIEEALEPTGAELAEVAVVRTPPDTEELFRELGPGFAAAGANDAILSMLGRRLGTQFVSGSGKQLDNARDVLFSRSSGEGGQLDGIVLVRAGSGQVEPDSDEPTEDDANTIALETGMITGVADSGEPTVAVERSGVADTSIPFFAPLDVATVDSVDLTSGQVALVFALLGAEGSFGIKDTANSLLPELLEPSSGG